MLFTKKATSLFMYILQRTGQRITVPFWALSITVNTGITRQCSGCIIQMATCLLKKKKKHDSLNSSSLWENRKLLLRQNLNISICFTTRKLHKCIQTTVQHGCSTWMRTHKSSPPHTQSNRKLVIKNK